MSFVLMNQYQLEIDTTPSSTPGSETYELLAAGITSIEPANNDEIDQTAYMDGNGWGTSTVTGAQLTYSVSGHRKTGDAAQDYIFSGGVQFGLGDARETKAKLTDPDGNTIEGPVTIANIEGPSGEANSKGEISFELHFNGQPIFTPAGP